MLNNKKYFKYAIWILILVLGVLVISMFSLCIGSVNIPLRKIFSVFFYQKKVQNIVFL